jgi:GntR family transcriptional regulator, transcriptional repressor for pyruvate dehydrogenase complex
MATPLTDQAILKIKDLIIAGEFGPGSRLPRERDLATRLGLSRNSLREAVRALALIGVLDTRVGDGTYVTSLDADTLLTGMGLVSDLLDGETLLEVHQVRRILEPVATGLAATRLTESDFLALEACLEQMEEADSNQAFIDADTEFHRIIVAASGNATLASVIQNLSGGMMRARLWRTITDNDAAQTTLERHRDIYVALRAGDAEQASAADLLHLADGERWLRQQLAKGNSLQSPESGNGHGLGGSPGNGDAP